MEDYYVRRVESRDHLQYCTLLDQIGKTLTRENVDDMKFLSRDHVKPRSILYEVFTGEQMLALLEGQHLLAENSLVFLQMLSYYIGRLDIYNMVVEFRKRRQRQLLRQGYDISPDYQS
ncbi:uncharacterized protein LOC102803763, partial [Saccoglossus kowalevskii]|uniref:Uncharacterized protein LOC102803763 n=1 Tax=Saccoglossus kowalevskii TaxID=10224 RepID=A0ABM0MB36_SACKO